MTTSAAHGIEEDRYAEVFANQERAETLRAIYRRAYGSDYPEEISPFGFVTRHDLDRFVDLLAGRTPRTLVDVGCGRGGPGVCVAGRLNGELIGIDVVPRALADAARLGARAGLRGFRFLRGSFERTTLPDHSCDAVMSVDALWMVWDKPAAFAEIARILRPGGQFLCTTWEPSHLDHRQLLGDYGFSEVRREETPDWLHR